MLRFSIYCKTHQCVVTHAGNELNVVTFDSDLDDLPKGTYEVDAGDLYCNFDESKYTDFQYMHEFEYRVSASADVVMLDAQGDPAE